VILVSLLNSEKIEVEIAEHIKGYYMVIINGLTIAHYGDKSKANEFVEHFMKINEDKNPVRLD
jgi:hypothetical protein